MIRDAIVIHVWAAAVFGGSPIMRTGINIIRQAVAIRVCTSTIIPWVTASNGAWWSGTAILFRKTWFFRAGIGSIRDTVPIGIGAAIRRWRPGFIRTGIFTIQNAVAIPVICDLRWTAVSSGGTGSSRFFRAGIQLIWNGITIPIGTTLGHRHTGDIGAIIDIIRDAITIAIRKFKTAIWADTWLIRAFIIGIFNIIAIGVLDLIECYSLDGLDIYRCLRAATSRIECACHQDMVSSVNRLPVSHQREGRCASWQDALARFIHLTIDPQFNARHFLFIGSDNMDKYDLTHPDLIPLAGWFDQYKRSALRPGPQEI
jgi:hypothetical protein